MKNETKRQKYENETWSIICGSFYRYMQLVFSSVVETGKCSSRPLYDFDKMAM